MRHDGRSIGRSLRRRRWRTDISVGERPNRGQSSTKFTRYREARQLVTVRDFPKSMLAEAIGICPACPSRAVLPVRPYRNPVQ